MTMPPSVVRLWAPIFLGLMMCLFLQHVALVYWLFALPLLPLVAFMATLAEVHDEGQRLFVRTLWKSSYVPKEDILRTEESFLDGIGVLRLRRFTFPWGQIYFVHEWSVAPTSKNERSFWSVLASAALGISGFVVARGLRTRSIEIEAPQIRNVAIAMIGVLLLVFVAIQKKKPSLANGALFAATAIIGLVRW